MAEVLEIPQSIQQLERSERGQKTCKMLLEFLNSNTVQFLDDENSHAVASLVARFMIGGSAQASGVIKALEAVTKKWNP